MASFLNNSGDIILDAVLTDYGRQLLAKGDGSFNITKFAFGDDEIDYQLWDQEAPTSLKDTEIMATPILESFTNNAASMKSKLLTIGIENLLYLPVLKLNTNIFDTSTFNSIFTGFICPINNQSNDSTNAITGSNGGVNSYKDAGLLNFSKLITIDQGLDSSNLDSRKSLFDELPELYEKEYNIIIDNRLGTIAPSLDAAPITPVSIDDDNMATYKVSETANSNFVQKIKVNGTNPTENAIISGYQGTRLSFTVRPSKAIENNNVLDRLGEQLDVVSGIPFRTVRTSVKIVGVTTGYSIELPVLFAKKVS